MTKKVKQLEEDRSCVLFVGGSGLFVEVQEYTGFEESSFLESLLCCFIQVRCCVALTQPTRKKSASKGTRNIQKHLHPS